MGDVIGRSDLAPEAPVTLGVVLGEAELIERIRQGDAAAFETLFHQYYQPLWTMAVRYVKAPEIARECVQDVFLRVWQQRARWQIRGSVRAYLFQAVRHATFNYSRGQQVVALWERRAVYDSAISGMGQGPEDPEVRLADHEMVDMVRRAVERLPARRREAFTLRWQEHLSNAEIAERMGVTVTCVEIHLAQALKAVRKAVTPLL